ncbi:Histone-lysine N-methyltransferase eggless [Frankliniella fusca]|uniref:Histone-lysine N-methyltransferase eggless n=1 Tax=Frankliniella fusca TaxID=407009 RepID=A0AAE1H1S0_9NEOP|nr:Histone-lysine N-methyltransferase eggless [Frankliniella fusca]
MEVDLTSDDEIVPAPKVSVPVLAKPSTPSLAKSSTVEMVDLSDDDDIIFETNAPQSSKSNTSQTKVSNTSVSNRSCPTKTPQIQDKVMVIDDDDVIEVVESHNSQAHSSKPKSTSEATPAMTLRGKSMTSTKPNLPSTGIDADDVIEVVGSPCPTGINKSTKSNQNSQGSKVKESNNIDAACGSLTCNKDDCDKPKRSNETGTKTVLENKNTRKEDDRYVVDITGCKKKIENNCLNLKCQFGEDLTSAPKFVVSFYGCNLNKGKYEVCAHCFEAAVTHHQVLAERLLHHEPLLAYEHFPVNDIQVVDLEPDEEEISDSEDPLPFSLLRDVEENLEEVLRESLANFDLDYQIKEATGILTDKMTSLELEGKESDDNYDKLQKEIDEMRRMVYKCHDPVIQETPSIEFTAYSLPDPCFPATPFPLYPTPPFKQYPVPPLHQRGVAMKKVTQVSSLQQPSSQRDVPSQEIVAISHQVNVQALLPPIGPLVRPKPRVNDIVYVMKMSFFGVWLKGRVMEVINNSSGPPPLSTIPQTIYKVKMEVQGVRNKFSIKSVPGKHLAYPNPAQVRLAVGTRVIAIFQEDDSNSQKQTRGGSYYSGLIAEPPKSNNNFRYLVFFDDGYAQYVPHNKILVVCESSRNVVDDIHPDSREFIRKYLDKYPERPMVKLAPNQVVKTEWNGKWWIARVEEVDGSLVKMSFDADKRTEWIYRGSTRLAPLYNTEMAQLQSRQDAAAGSGSISRMRGMGVRRENKPYVEYTRNVGAEDEPNEPLVSAPTTVRAVAKKSTSKKQEPSTFPSPPSKHIGSYSPENIGAELQLPKGAPMPKRYQTHTCSPNCIDWVKYDPKKMKGYNPLTIPLYCGWQRELPKFRKKSTIMYTAPCGRRLRNMEDLHKYLRICRSQMSVDLFDFDFWVNALSEFTISDKVKKCIQEDDMSYGKENVKIPLINYVDYNLPSNLQYETQRKPYEGVHLNTDPNFLCGCDCTDDCQDKEKCACWQLTIQGSSLYPGGVVDPNVGYYYKRLQERVITGIYECNQQCKCSKSTCLNRVVQHPLQLKLQLFKTPNKGWGLRCVNDIPKGTFICIYAGYLYTEQTANKIGELDGDDYLAELDYIEVVERMKEDYESDVEDEFPDEDEPSSPKSRYDNKDDSRLNKSKNKEEVDADFRSPWKSHDANSDDTIRSRLRKRGAAELDATDDKNDKSTKRREPSRGGSHGDDGSDDEKLERQPSSFTPKPLKKPGATLEQPIHRFQSVRKFYGPNERVYIMDANKVGNIGRYLNHSCSPNVFVQNVFVDTHDLRFPWVAFFALTYIKAGSELTWDYNYDVGSVPDKIIICQCGSSECRGRLL